LYLLTHAGGVAASPPLYGIGIAGSLPAGRPMHAAGGDGVNL